MEDVLSHCFLDAHCQPWHSFLEEWSMKWALQLWVDQIQQLFNSKQ
jgi:hypothetical protein